MIKKIKYLLAIFFILIAAIATSNNINHENIKKEITSQINKISGVNFKINGKVRKSFITSSSIIIEKANLQIKGFQNTEFANIDVKKIKITFAPFSNYISNISLYSPEISYQLSYPNSKDENKNKYISKYIKKISDRFIQKDIDINIKNALFRLQEDNYRYLELKNINLTTNYNFDNGFFDSSLDLIFNNKRVNGSIVFKEYIEISSKSDILNLDIKFNKNKFLLFDEEKLEGKFKLNIKNISLMSEIILPLSNMSRILAVNHNPIYISGELKENNKNISLVSGSIVSDIINGKVSGEITKDKVTKTSLIFDVANLNFTKLFDTQKASLKKVYKAKVKNYKNKINNEYDLEFNIDDAYLKNQNIKDLKITLKNKNNHLNIESNIIKIGNFTSKIKGNLILDFRNFLFSGNIEGEGRDFGNIFQYAFKELGLYKIIKNNFHNKENYQFSSDVELTPYSIFIKKSKINIEDKQISGSTLIDGSKPDKDIEADLVFKNFNVVSGQDQNSSLIGKSFKLTTINHHYKLLVNLKKTKIYNYLIDDINFNLILDQNYLNLDNINVSSPNINFSSSLNITLNEEDPKLNLLFKAKRIFLQKYSDLGNIFFEIPSLEGFISDIYIDIKNFKIKNLQTNNLKIISTINDDAVLNIMQSDQKVYNGKLNHDSKIYLGKKKSIDLKFKIINADLQNILSDVIGLKQIKSKLINVAGYFSTQGKSNKDFIKNANSVIKFNAKKIEIENFGLVELQKKILDKKKSNDFRIDSKKALEKGSSKLQNLQGSIKIDSKKQENIMEATISSYGIVASATSTFNISKESFNLLSQFKFYVAQGSKPILLLLALKANKTNILYNTSQIDSYLKILYESLSRKTNNQKNSAP